MGNPQAQGDLADHARDGREDAGEPAFFLGCMNRLDVGTSGPAPSKKTGTIQKERIDMHVTGIITALIFGLAIGALGRLVLPGRQSIPIWLTVVVGIVAALIGTAIATGLGFADTNGIDWRELAVQVVLAAVGVAAVAGFYGRRAVR